MNAQGIELEPRQAQAYIQATPGLQLVDVRSPDEHREARIKGSKLISLQTLEARLSELDRAKPLLLYCHSGGRSGRALAYLHQQGFSQAKHIAGGIMTWAEHGLPYESGAAS
jgi:rhodanese-related sulfurtransferase